MKISIVTPCYNSGQHIEATIKSIWSQDYQNFEHIVMDGLSKDNTVDIVKRYPGIRLFSERDTGQSNALNKGFRKTTGDILAWQNADDIYHPGAFKKVVEVFEQHPEIDLIYGNYTLIRPDDSWICDVYPPTWNEWKFIHGRFVPLQPTVFWRRKVYETVGDLDELLHYCMDVDFFSRCVLKKFRFQHVDFMLGGFRVHDESKTQNASNRERVAAEYLSVLSRNFHYNLFDKSVFKFFEVRSRLAKTIKLKWPKKF